MIPALSPLLPRTAFHDTYKVSSHTPSSLNPTFSGSPWAHCKVWKLDKWINSSSPLYCYPSTSFLLCWIPKSWALCAGRSQYCWAAKYHIKVMGSSNELLPIKNWGWHCKALFAEATLLATRSFFGVGHSLAALKNLPQPLGAALGVVWVLPWERIEAAVVCRDLGLFLFVV